MYFNSSHNTSSCLPCSSPCVTCTNMDTSCDSCDVTYTHFSGPPGDCLCDDSVQMFYSSATLGCVPCSDHYDNCLSCQKNASDSSKTECSSCANPYYPDPTTTVCLPCDTKCSSCTSQIHCSGCLTNMKLVSNSC